MIFEWNQGYIYDYSTLIVKFQIYFLDPLRVRVMEFNQLRVAPVIIIRLTQVR